GELPAKVGPRSRAAPHADVAEAEPLRVLEDARELEVRGDLHARRRRVPSDALGERLQDLPLGREKTDRRPVREALRALDDVRQEPQSLAGLIRLELHVEDHLTETRLALGPVEELVEERDRHALDVRAVVFRPHVAVLLAE